jgi:thiol-disulfide isomerase/thioredoxin
MSILSFLQTDDFEIKNGSEGPILCNKIPGYSLIMFYSTKCSICQEILPMYKRLPGTVFGCQFGIVNVSLNRDLVEMSRKTKSRLEYVPYIVMYIEGKPFMSYKGRNTEKDIIKFVQDVHASVNNRQKGFVTEKGKTEVNTVIPAYTIGVPVQGDKNSQVCYISWLDYSTKGGKR